MVEDLKNELDNKNNFINSFKKMLPDKNIEEKINLNDINNLSNDIINDPIIEGKDISFQNFIIFLQEIISGKINNLNKKEAYRVRISNIEHEIVNAPEGYKIKAYIKHINNLKRILFGDNTSETEGNDGKKTEEEEINAEINAISFFYFTCFTFFFLLIKICYSFCCFFFSF